MLEFFAKKMDGIAGKVLEVKINPPRDVLELFAYRVLEKHFKLEVLDDEEDEDFLVSLYDADVFEKAAANLDNRSKSEEAYLTSLGKEIREDYFEAYVLCMSFRRDYMSGKEAQKLDTFWQGDLAFYRTYADAILTLGCVCVNIP